jgi:hypothetical protein
VLSVPLVGRWARGGAQRRRELSRPLLLGHLYTLHVYFLPVAIGALIGLHLFLLIYQKHTQFERDPASVVVGRRFWPDYALRTIAVFGATLAVLALLAALVEINPIEDYGPYQPWIVMPTVPSPTGTPRFSKARCAWDRRPRSTSSVIRSRRCSGRASCCRRSLRAAAAVAVHREEADRRYATHDVLDLPTQVAAARRGRRRADLRGDPPHARRGRRPDRGDAASAPRDAGVGVSHPVPGRAVRRRLDRLADRGRDAARAIRESTSLSVRRHDAGAHAEGGFEEEEPQPA